MTPELQYLLGLAAVILAGGVAAALYFWAVGKL